MIGPTPLGALATPERPVEGFTLTNRDHAPLLAGGLPTQYVDVDPAETDEWQASLDAVVDHAGAYRARYLMLAMLRHAAERNVGVPSLRSPATRASSVASGPTSVGTPRSWCTARSDPASE
jgi:hypothetical protein